MGTVIELHYNVEQQAYLFAPSTNKFEISWREPTKESREKVEKVYQKIGFPGKIIAIHTVSIVNDFLFSMSLFRMNATAM